MESIPLQVRMLGEFSIRRGVMEVNDSDNRSRKVWLLLAYLICRRGKVIPTDELVGLLWGEDERTTNPINALKTTLHRARACLDQLGDGVGRTLIVFQDGGYMWTTDTPLTIDIDEFDRLCQAGVNAQRPEDKLDCWLRALPLYQGNFLSKLSFEPWVAPIAAHYHNLYVQTVLSALPMLEERGDWQEAADLCRRAAEHAPFLEDIYRHLMTALLRLGDQPAAATVYEQMSELLLANFGIMPSVELRDLYREALSCVNDRTVPSGVILDQLREPTQISGAYLCDYDFFRAIYQSVARLVRRNGDSVHLLLISVESKEGRELPRRSLDCAMENLEELIRSNLRRGDVFTRCSVSQFVLMLPRANYENTCMICDRIVKAFSRQYPHSPALLHTSIHPMEPN